MSPSEYLLLGGIGLFLTWTGTVIGFVMWLSNKFNELMPREYYDQKHEVLEERVRHLELQVAARSWGEEH